MGRVIPFAAIPDSNVFPDGIFHLKVEKVEEVLTKEREGKAQKLMYKVTSKVVAPTAYKGMFYTDNLCIGTEEDPEAELLETWQTSIGGKNLKKLAKAVGIPFGDEEDSDSFINAIKSAEYLVTIVQKVDDGEKNPQYKGRVNNNVTSYWKVGEKDAQLTNGEAKTPKATRTKTTTTEAKPAPSDEVSCSACKKRVPRKELKAHVDQHLKELAQPEATPDSDE